ncbi:PAS domain S-box-containing protein [Rhizobiales bacterium GAS191]|nr:PAS domain S-box-containing protein [Rhizobiales bacterium GAS191]
MSNAPEPSKTKPPPTEAIASGAVNSADGAGSQMTPASWIDGGLQVIREDGERVLCRGRRNGADGVRDAVLVVLPAAEQPTPGILNRLAHEYGLRGELDGAWAVRPVELARERGRTMLILEDPGGEPLDELVGSRMEMGRFLRLAVALSAALGRLHERGLIHKDIKPANVLVNSATGQVWLTGFGIASRLPRERQPPEPPEIIAGTLAYMAPEQTGRMNRSIDSRSDLYALGVTLFEMLTGALPFTASDPMEWVHCHIARQPPSERMSDVPAPVSAIIMKLLAKTAEDRYQTATGVGADLRRCLAELESRRHIAPFRLGEHDASDQLLMAEKLYGRDRERQALLDAFDQMVTTGTPILVLVSGYSGIGKSSVVNELHKPLVPPRGIFTSGKFDQYKRNIPYATIAQAFQTLTRQILCKSDAEVGYWREAIQTALGPNAQLIVDLVPEIEFVIGKQAPVPELPPTEAQARFHMVLRSFLGVFARKEHPLALFLDDLQWLDAATLRLLEDLATDPDIHHLMLIGAFRDNEVTRAHPLARTLDAIRQSGAIVRDIVLAPLSLSHVTELLADTLHCREAVAVPLARLLHEKTLGNPFFAIQFLTALREEHLLMFDAREAAWMWDLSQIEARGFTDNVVDLMVDKLKRLQPTTREALKQLACLGNRGEIAMLSIVCGKPVEDIHRDFWESVRLGLIVHLDGAFKFAHDRVQEAAYSLIPLELRADAHLRIGRKLIAEMAPREVVERIFEVVNQLNGGASLLTDDGEKQRIAELNLMAARRAKASTAYASACIYLSQAMALLECGVWTSRYDLAFAVWLERAECEFLSGHFDVAEPLLEELLRRGATNVDKAAAYRIKIELYVVRSENALAIDCALECLRLFGIAMPAHPTSEQVRAEYETVWKGLGERSIGSLIDLPLSSDPEVQAAMRVLSLLYAPSLFTDLNLIFLHLCKMVNLSLRSGSTDAASTGYGWLGIMLGPVFHRYAEGYEFAKLACDLVEKHDFTAYRAKAYFAMEIAALWTQPVATGLQYLDFAFRAGIETGDLTVACYSRNHTVTDLLLRGDPLQEVWHETERGLEFVRKAKFRDVVDVIVSQQRFILNMRGLTSSLSTFSDSVFDEDAFEAQLGDDRMSTMVCWYWILKLQARFISGDYGAALTAGRKAKELLWSSVGHIQLLDYYFYSSLAVAALWEDGLPPSSLSEWRDLLTAHVAQLREWSENGSATFRDKFELVAAEISRIEKRDHDAMGLYEQAIRSARANGFVHNEALANELAARFYAARGFEKIAHAYLQDARYCYLRWGAAGKVRQFDQLYPNLREKEPTPSPTSTIGAPVEHLDLATIIKISQAVSGEMVLEKLIDTLMRTAIEHAGAERGLLILPRGIEQRIEAEAMTGGDGVTVHLRDASMAASALPQSIAHYVARTQDSVILDDAAVQNPFSVDPYIPSHSARSILCLPLVNQGKLVAVLYLENNLAPGVFTPSRIAVLKLLASQAAISLENTRLYRDLEEREAKIRRLVDSNIIGIFIWDIHGRIIEANEAFMRLVMYDRDDLASDRMRWTDLTPAKWREADKQAVSAVQATGTVQPYEKELLRKDGLRVPVLLGAAAFGGRRDQGVAFVLDLTDQKRAEDEIRETERRYREVQMELAHANRLATMGQLSASIAHEVAQPMAAVLTSAHAAVRWLSAQPARLDEVQHSLDRIVGDSNRARDVISRIRSLVAKAPSRMDCLEINEAIHEVIGLVHGELVKNHVSVQTKLAEGSPLVLGDRVQLQQVILNLIINAVEAMSGDEGPRQLLISTGRAESGGAFVEVCDSGPGLTPESLQRAFDAFYTTKPSGLGMGLSICRSIIEAHGGRLWVTVNEPRGAVFQFTLPIHAQGVT